MKPLFYLAGPITRPDPMVNTSHAIRLAEELMVRYPIVLFTPQLSVLHQLVAPRSHAEWLDYDFNIIVNTFGIIRIAGDSVGADMETHFAEAMDLPVFELNEHGIFPMPVHMEFTRYLSSIVDDGSDGTDFNTAVAEAQAWGDDQYTVRYAAARV